MCTKRTAIYGGTFDPIHKAHVTLADYAVKEFKLDELYFMPAYISPFKQETQISSGQDRLQMIDAVLPYNSAFRVSDYELLNEKPSYTFDTLTYWKSRLEGKLYFVLGIDSLIQIESWYRGKELISSFPIITDFSRPGTDKDTAKEKISELVSKYDAEINIVDMPAMDVSATEIRKLASEGKSISEYVLPEVEGYIIEHKLYK